MLPQLLAAAVGLWLMAAPAVLGLGEAPSNLCWILGPVAASMAIMAASQVLRAVRWANVPIGIAVAAGAWLTGASGIDLAVLAVSGLALALLSIPGGTSSGQLGGGWRSLFGDQSPP